MIGVGLKKVVLLPKPGTGSGSRGGCTAADFCKFLEPHVGLLRGKTLLLDGASIHRSAETVEFLRKNSIQVLEGWPPHSPDLNPIENWWSWLKKRISKVVSQNIEKNDKNAELVWNEVKKGCADTSPSLLDSYVDAFLSRLEKVRAEGPGLKQ